MSNRQADQSLNVFELIEQICADFRMQWKDRKNPKIEAFLRKVPAHAQTTLFRNLLSLELRFLQASNRSLTSDDYKKRFPEHTGVIREMFLEPTLGSIDPIESTPFDQPLDHTIAIDTTSVSQIGDYQILDKLGQGGFGVVYKARHSSRGNIVALKTLPTGMAGQEVIADRLHRFRNEFRRLAEINHPNLVGMQSLEVDGGQWFFTMDLVNGVDFLEWTRPDNQIDETRLREALSQLAIGIHELHSRGIIHRDLKPSNILVDESGWVTILDFGLAEQLSDDFELTVSLQSAQFAGTPQYAAPEQFDGKHSEASDWYSLGVMLYRVLTGTLPFDGSFHDLARRKPVEDAPRLQGRDGIPTDLSVLTDQLLSRATSERGNATFVSKMLGLDFDRPVSRQDESHRSILSNSETELIGRERQLAQLEGARQRLTKQRQPTVVFISGRSGEGKSSLADEFLRPLRSGKDFVVLEGRCYDRESVPFKAIDAIINSLVSYLRETDSAQVETWLPLDTFLLAELFPVLRRVEAIAKVADRHLPEIESEKLRRRAFQAFNELLVAIGERSPIVMLIDDLQWGDAESAEILHRLMIDSDQSPIMLLGGYRSDEVDKSAFMQVWRERSASEKEGISSTDVLVGPLNAAQCEELLLRRLGTNSQAAQLPVEKIRQDTDGNPYLIEQLIESLDGDRDSIRVAPLTEVVKNRLSRLPNQAESLLMMIAVYGQSVSVSDLTEIANQSSSVLSLLTRMSSEKLIRLVGAEASQQVDTYHDRIRETVVGNLDQSDRRRCHLQIAEFIERWESTSGDEWMKTLEQPPSMEEQQTTAPDRLFDLAYHFGMAGDERAFPYHLIAGQKSIQADAPHEALEHAHRAEAQLSPNASPTVRYRLSNIKGEALVRLKNLKQALLCLGEARNASPTELDRAQVLATIGIVHQMSADYKDATLCLDEALNLIGYRRPKSKFGNIISMIRCAGWVLFVPASNFSRATSTRYFRLRLANKIYLSFANYLMELDSFGWLAVYPRQAWASTRLGTQHGLAVGNIMLAFWLVAMGFHR